MKKKEKNKNIIVLILIVIFLTLIISGATFAFFSATATNDTAISGRTLESNITLYLSKETAGNLIPTDDSLVTNLLNETPACIDDRNYYGCNIYKITIANTTSSTQNFSGYFITNTQTTTYNSNHLKYAIYTKNNNTYTIASDGLAISTVSNTKNYFKQNNTNLVFTLNSNQQKEYYLVLWLSNINSNQLEDQDKKYAGTIVFESSIGRVSATFSQ